MFLQHYGVKGMRWGVRKRRVRSALKKRSNKEFDEDLIVKKGHTFENVITRYQNDKKDYNYEKKRTYVSDLGFEYLNIGDTTADGFGETKVRQIVNNKDFRIAGQKSINKVLKEIGEKPIADVYEKGKSTSPDFLFKPLTEKEKERNEKFIQRMKDRRYDGMIDPLDAPAELATINEKTARILFNMKDVTIKEITADKYLERFVF